MQDSIARILKAGREQPAAGKPLMDEVGDDDYKSVYLPCEALEEQPSGEPEDEQGKVKD